MSRLAHYYRTLVSAEISALAAYRAQLIVGIFGWVVPFAMIALWRTAAGGGSIEGITGAQFTTYFVGVLVCTNLNRSVGVVFSLSALVHSGQLSALLLRPFHPIHAIVAKQTAQTTIQALPVAAIAAVTIVALGGEVATDWRAWVVAPVTFMVGVACTSYIGAMVGSLALWMTKSDGVQGLILGLEWIIGGLVAPAMLLPDWLAAVARVQPFWFAIGAPSELVAGISPAWIGVRSIGLGLVWLVILHFALAATWRRGMVRYEAVGT